jgi:hypothetical protein
VSEVAATLEWGSHAVVSIVVAGRLVPAVAAGTLLGVVVGFASAPTGVVTQGLLRHEDFGLTARWDNVDAVGLAPSLGRLTAPPPASIASIVATEGTNGFWLVTAEESLLAPGDVRSVGSPA